MKKNLLILFFAICIGNVCVASVFNVFLYKKAGINDEHVENMPMERSLSDEPYVLFDDGTNTISITSDKFIENSCVTITDSDGVVIVSDVISLSDTASYIQVPDYVENEKYKIEIAYNGICLYGFINHN